MLQGAPDALERAVVATKVELTRQHRLPEPEASSDDLAVVEAVVSPQSLLIGRTPEDLRLFDRFNVNLLAVSRQGARIQSRLRSTPLRAGDVVILQGDINQLPEILGELDCLPLADRKVTLTQTRQGLLPVAIFAVAIGCAVVGVMPIAIAFFAAAVLVLVTGALPLRDVYHTLDGPMLVMLAALIPIGDAVQTSGGTELIAQSLSTIAAGLPPIGALAVVLIAAMAVTPVLSNAATALVMAPIAAGVAKSLGLNPDAFLMAVAVGASCDFLTPFGHQCNTLVMGPGGYRFGDYVRLGLPLSVMIIVLALPLIVWFWPLAR